MHEEVGYAVEFLVKIMGGAGINQQLICEFSRSLSLVLLEHYDQHWFPEMPIKGSAYRCLRIVNKTMDPLLAKAGRNSGLSELNLLRILPAEFTLWVDPEEVAYRIGEDGSIGVVYTSDSRYNSDADSIDSSDSQSSDEAQDHSQDTFQSCKDYRNISQPFNFFTAAIQS